jgi:hypothetical protein
MSIVTRNTIFGAIIVSLLVAESAWAQYGMPAIPARKGKAPAADSRVPKNLQIPFQGTGTIEAVAPGGMQVTAAGAVWQVKFDKNCKVEVTGTADPNFLRPGLLIRFTTEVDNKGKVTAPLNELEIVSPQNAMVFAKARATAAAAKAKGEEGETPPEATGMVGRITAIKNNDLTIEIGSGSIRATLGPNPAIKVNANDYSLAQQGDKVDVKGWYIQPPDAMAQDVKITLTSPLGGTTKKAAPKPADKTAATKDAAAK